MFCTIGIQQRNAGRFRVSVCALPYGQVLQPNLQRPSNRFLYISCATPVCSRRGCWSMASSRYKHVKLPQHNFSASSLGVSAKLATRKPRRKLLPWDESASASGFVETFLMEFVCVVKVYSTIARCTMLQISDLQLVATATEFRAGDLPQRQAITTAANPFKETRKCWD